MLESKFNDGKISVHDLPLSYCPFHVVWRNLLGDTFLSSDKKIKSDWPENQKIIVGVWIFASVFIGAGTFTVGLLILLNVIKIPT